MINRKIKKLLEGKLSKDEIYKIIISEKEPDRFMTVLKILQEKLGWKERIILPLSDKLFIVCKDDTPIIKCACGYEFGDYRINWKFKTKVYVRNDENSIKEIYGEGMGSDPEYMEIREYYCPKCFSLLEVEVVPPGYPPLFNFLPDISSFYRKWLKKELPCEVEFKDKSLEYIHKIKKDFLR